MSKFFTPVDFSDVESKLFSKEVEDRPGPKLHKVDPEVLKNIRAHIENELKRVEEGSSPFVRGAIQRTGTVVRQFLPTLFNGYPTKENIENFIAITKQDYGYRLAQYFAEKFSVIYEKAVDYLGEIK